MKRRISFFLTILLLFTTLCPLALAENKPYRRVNDRIPTIVVAGDGNAICIPDENAEGGERKVLSGGILRDLFTSSDEEEDDNSNLKEALVNVLMPFFKEGVLKDNWDPYYEALQKEIGDLFYEAQLDKNGNAQFGTNVSGWCQWNNWFNQNNDNKGDKGYYGLDDYRFWYDWRLDPMESARTLNEYIQNVKRVTNSDQIALFTTCLGSNVAMAYIAQFGTKDLYSLGINATVSNGSEFISEALSGKAKLDGHALVRFLKTSAVSGMFSPEEFTIATIDLATKAGILDGTSKFLHATIYDKVVQGVTSALALGTFFTFPCYWSAVCPESYDEAIRFVFGNKGTEKRLEYHGLIKKLNKYHNKVGLHIKELLKSAGDQGVKLSILGKYGLQMVPLNQSNELVGDEFASLHRAAFGATTSSIFDTLSDEYVAQRTAEGKGRYISPDHMVDASTCLYPDYTWFIKGTTHVHRTEQENELQYTCLTADRQLTIDDFEWTQFMVYNNETLQMMPMTADNCHTEPYSTNKNDEQPKSLFARLKLFLEALKQWTQLLSNNMKESLRQRLQDNSSKAERLYRQ